MNSAAAKGIRVRTFCATLATLFAVEIGVAHPMAITITLLSLAGVGISLHRRRPTQLPPTRHARRVTLDHILD